MAQETYTLQRLLLLRKITRAIGDSLRGRLKDYLTMLNPLLRPKAVFGDLIQGTSKDAPLNAERAFKELATIYQSVASGKPFNLTRELTAHLDLASTSPDLVPVDYAHAINTGSTDKTVLVSTPLKWVLTYSGYTPARLKEMLASKTPPAGELYAFVVQHAAINVIFTRRPGISGLLEALRFPVSVTKLPEFGELPLTCISAPVPTLRPPDDIILESTELSGKDAFEEVVDLEQLQAMHDPLKEDLVEIARGFGELTEAARA